MQSMSKATAAAGRPQKLTIFNTLSYIYRENGIKGLYRGVTPRIGLGIWQTVCMVSFADYVKAWYVSISSERVCVHLLTLRLPVGSRVRVTEGICIHIRSGLGRLEARVLRAYALTLFIATLRSYQCSYCFLGASTFAPDHTQGCVQNISLVGL